MATTLKIATGSVARNISRSEAERRSRDMLAQVKAEHEAAMAKLSVGQTVTNVLSGQKGVVVALNTLDFKNVRVDFNGREKEVNPMVLDPAG